jgi:TrmH family RNA methyltransferase
LRLLTVARDLKRRKARERQQRFVAEGVRAVEELLRSPIEIEGVLTSPPLGATPRGAALHTLLREHGVEVCDISDTELASASDTDSPQGVLAIGRIPVRSLDQIDPGGPSRPRLLLLDAIQDPGNAGTMLRTAAAFGAAATLAMPGTVDLWNAKVVRSSMGAVFNHLSLDCTWEEADAFLLRREFVLWGASANGTPLDETDHPPRLGLVIGNEGSGLSEQALARVARRVAIPIHPAVESLNAAVAAGILLHNLRS